MDAKRAEEDERYAEPPHAHVSGNTVKRVGEEKGFLRVPASQIRWLIADICDDGKGGSLDRGPLRCLEVGGGRVVRAIGHHVDGRVTIVPRGAQVRLRRRTLRFRAAGDEENR